MANREEGLFALLAILFAHGRWLVWSLAFPARLPLYNSSKCNITSSRGLEAVYFIQLEGY